MKLSRVALRFPWNAFIGACIAAPTLVGCSRDGDEVSIGETGQAVSLDACYPGDASCEDPWTADLPPVEVSSGSCTPGGALRTTVYALPKLPSGFDNGLGGDIGLVADAVASPDGSIWFLAVGYPEVPSSELPMRVFVYQIQQDGTELGKALLPAISTKRPAVGENAPQQHLVVDQNGIATVVMSDDAIRFHRFSKGVKAQGTVGELVPLPNELVEADGVSSYVIAADNWSFDGSGILSRVTASGTLERSNNQLPSDLGGSGLIALTSHGQSGYGVLVRRGPADYAIFSYDRDLKPVSAVQLPEGLPYDGPLMVAGERGRVFLAELLASGAVGLYGIDLPVGASLFGFEVGPRGESIANLRLAPGPGGNKAWVHFDHGVQSGKLELISDSHLAELDAERGSCTLHDYDTPDVGAGQLVDYKGQLLISPEGVVFLMTAHSLVRFDEVSAE